MANRTAFSIQILGHPMTLLDWKLALAARKSDSPKLSAEQKRAAREFKETPADYARRELAGRLAKERMEHRAGLLGEAVLEILKKQGGHYQLLAVILDMAKDRWILTIEAPGGEKECSGAA